METTGQVTMEDVARASGVSRSTVSKALRNDPSISAHRREKIKAVALKLKYRPNPLVAALMAQLHHTHPKTNSPTLAWVDLWTKTSSSKYGFDPGLLLPGAKKRAQELGYEMDVFRPMIENISPRRLLEILRARSEWGAIFPTVPEAHMEFPLNMAGLSGVTIGTSLGKPTLNRVSHNHYHGSLLACQTLWTKGFRRIGLVVSPWGDERMDGKWRAAYIVRQQQWPVGARLPPLIADQDDREEFLRWYQRYKPDAILVEEQSRVATWLDAKGGLPARIVWLGLDPSKHNAWGVDYRWSELGQAAVELLIAQMQRRELGTPAISHTLTIDGIWVER